jgi:GMP synthase (glutamine-hydrolysing)
VREALASIAVVDFGGQYTHLISRTIRELGYRADVRTAEEMASGALSGAAGIVLSGGPDSVLGNDLAEIAKRISGFPRPMLGICFGHQLLATVFGGTVEAARTREYGIASIQADGKATLFQGLPARQTVWMSHGDHVEAVPPGFRVTASTESLAVAAFESADKRVHGVQFHPEVVHTQHGRAMLERFIRLCASQERDGLTRLTWSAEQVRDDILDSIRREAKDRTLFLLVSGGVDSLVALDLCVAAVGRDRVQALHIDTGFMRRDESREIREHLAALGHGNLRVVDASDRYFAALAGIVHPEEKRAIVGRLFVEVFRDALREIGIADDWMLVQGTIYPDRIETGATQRADRIKTHHNRVEEIRVLMDEGRIIEPLSELYKHEVRQLGALLGLPAGLLMRQPFPGPGLAIRIVCSATTMPPPCFDVEREQLSALVAAVGLDGTVLPVHSVGVQGDARTYRHPAVVWPRRPGPVDWQAVKAAAAQAINRLPTINRVVLSTNDPRSQLTLGVCLLDRRRVGLLQEVDAVAREATAGMADIWQMPVVALPLFDALGNQAFVLRPVCSRDAMTADVYEMDHTPLSAMVSRLKKIAGVGAVLYDVTTKPPGTIEWE